LHVGQYVFLVFGSFMEFGDSEGFKKVVPKVGALADGQSQMENLL
jgi:hypothetical protein